MLIVISPSKTLDTEIQNTHSQYTLPYFIDHSESLINICQQLSVTELEKLMKISPNLAELNRNRFMQWHKNFSSTNAKQAIFMFKGDVYEGLDVSDFSEQDLQFSQQHLRILSGLYGLLKPLDLMLPYRLEMGTKLKNNQGSNLYQFWGTLLAKHLNQQLAEEKQPALINLASDEYIKAVPLKQINAPIIKPIFLDEKRGEYKIISFYAKKARGLMSRFIIKNQLTDIESLKSFNLSGYQFCSSKSSDNEWVFLRAEQAAQI